MQILGSLVLLVLASTAIATPEPMALAEAKNDAAYRAWFFSPEERKKRRTASMARRGVSPKNNPIYNPLLKRQGPIVDCSAYRCTDGSDDECNEADMECTYCPGLVGETVDCLASST